MGNGDSRIATAAWIGREGFWDVDEVPRTRTCRFVDFSAERSDEGGADSFGQEISTRQALTRNQ